MKHVLLVDDDLSIVGDYSFLFGDDGTYKITTTTGPKQALETAGKGGIDLLMTDLNMPEMDGATLIGKVHGISPNTKFILTNDSQNKVRGALEALKNLAELKKQDITIAYLQKPYLFDEVKGLIKSLIGE